MTIDATEVAHRVASSPAVDSAVSLLERLNPETAGALTVLTYHRIDEAAARPELFPGLLSATPGDFRAQMEALRERWTPVSLDQVLAARRGARLPRRAVLVTIDDGYQDVALNAWPILRDVAVPAVLFVPTGFADDPDRTFWWDDLHAAIRSAPDGRFDTPAGPIELGDTASRSAAFRLLRSWFKKTPHPEAIAGAAAVLAALGATPRRPPVLGWDELRRLAREGLDLAPHSVTHAMLDRLDRVALADEIATSRRRLAEETGADPPAFAYPSGQHDDHVVRAVADAGIEVAFTTERGRNRPRRIDWLRLRRINVGHRMPPAAVRAQLLPGVAALAARLA